MTRVRTTFAVLALAGPLCADPPTESPRTDDFFSAVGLARRPDPSADVWKVAEPPSQFAWMTDSGPLPTGAEAVSVGRPDPFQQILDRLTDADDRPRSTIGVAPGLIVDPGRWRYKLETTGDLYRRTSKLEVPDPQEVWVPYGVRNWKAQEKVTVPVPISVPTAEQLFVYGQFDGSGDALTHAQMSLSGKSGVGLKWALVAGSEVQLRYATLLSYADTSPSRVQPALEVLAKLPLYLQAGYCTACGISPAVTFSTASKV